MERLGKPRHGRAGREAERAARASQISHDKRHCAFNTSMNAFWGMLIFPMLFIRFFPSFCFSSNFRLRVISPPLHFAVTFFRNAEKLSREIIFPPIAA